MSLNAITPTFTLVGTSCTKRRAAAFAAASLVGLTSVAVIDPDTSVASMIDACSTGTATVRCGLATAMIRSAIAVSTATMGRCVRQPGRRGATDACTAGAANAAARARLFRCSPT